MLVPLAALRTQSLLENYPKNNFASLMPSFSMGRCPPTPRGKARLPWAAPTTLLWSFTGTKES